MDVIEGLFETHNIGKSKDFGIVVVNLEGLSFEVAQFRVDSKESDGRRPNEVRITDSFQEDVKRRDFTINALGLDKDGNVIDFVGGVDDIKRGVIRTVGDPVERFEEDHLRMLRAVRFSSRFNFEIEDETFSAIRTLKEKITNISPERIRAELVKMADNTGSKFAESIKLLDHTKLLEVILPEVKALQDVQESVIYHPEAYRGDNDGTTFCHVMEALKQNVKVDYMINLSVLFHDLGKPVTHTLEYREKMGQFMHRFTGHGEAGVPIIEGLCDRLKFTSYEKSVFTYISKNHMVLFHCRKMKKSTMVKHGNHPFYFILKEVMFCDDSSRVGLFNHKEFFGKLELVESTVKEFHQYKSKETVKVVSGLLVMNVTGLKPSPLVGGIIKEVSDRLFDATEFFCVKQMIEDVASELK